jgi:glycosyltransferase involved in cell wall biosynthesis
VSTVEPPLVSCVIPVFNGERHVGEAIDSVLGQNHRPLEVIVVDDGSTDATADVVQSRGDAVRYVRQANAGPSSARNHGVQLARGALVAFLDADDRWLPGKLARQIAALTERPELDGCLTHGRLFWDGDGAIAAEESAWPSERRIDTGGLIGSTLVMRRRVFDTVGVFDPTLPHSGTAEWFTRAREQGAVMETIAEVLIERRMHAGNFSRQRAVRDEEYFRLLKRSLDRKRAGPSSP